MHPNELAAAEVPRRRFRKLRIAWSVGWGVVTVLLIALWVRSGRWEDRFGWTITQRHSFSISSAMERVLFSWRISDMATGYPNGFTVVQALPERFVNRVREIRRAGGSPENAFGISIPRGVESTRLSIPHLWLAVLSASIAAVPWIKWRFSLRNLLIAMSLAAVALGIMYSTSGPRPKPPADDVRDDNPFG
jgi:hypothetical protein